MKLSFPPHSQSISAVINDFCSCDLLAWAVEQQGILGRGQSKTHKLPGSKPLALLSASSCPQMSPWARGIKNISPELVSAFPLKLLLPARTQGTVDPCVPQPRCWAGNFLGPPDSQGSTRFVSLVSRGYRCLPLGTHVFIIFV